MADFMGSPSTRTNVCESQRFHTLKRSFRDADKCIASECAGRTKPLCGGRYRVLDTSDIGDFETRSLEEWSVSRYDEAVVTPCFMVKSMNFDFGAAPPSALLFNNFPTKTQLNPIASA